MTYPAPESLYWLPPPPEDFRQQAKALAVRPDLPGAALQWLATHALDLNQHLQLAKSLARLEGRPASDGTLSEMRLALLADGTTDYVAPATAAAALRHGVRLSLFVADYGQSVQALLDSAGPLEVFAPEVALIAPDHRALGLAEPTLDGGAAAAAVSAALDRVEMMCRRAQAIGAQPIVQTLAAPPESWCGHLDAALPGSVASQIDRFNAGLVGLAEAGKATLLDVGMLAGLVGTARWHDHAQWHSAKLPFSLDMTPLYADHVARLLAALRGKSRKCLVLDLDNTLWGGIIGDDGLDGIVLGQGSADGEAYLAIQHYALALKERGIVLAVCSKNEEDAARLPFRDHSEMLLREEHLAAFVVNWDDKATNLTRIAAMLNIGVDALAFLDDNPAERARIRQMLPQVAVPELPADPAGYPAALAQAGYFETVALSADDARRAEQYRANAARAATLEALGDMDAYLRSLEMVCDLRPFDQMGRARIAQLINKSNQYNLTTRRYSEAQVAAIEADPGRFTLQLRLADRFGDNGMISVLIFDRDGEEWRCDTWLMSCRVIGRRVEEAALAAVAAAAKGEGAARLVGDYIPSAKNRMSADHFERLGFSRMTDLPDGGSRWSLDLRDYVPPDLPMRIVAADTLLSSAA